MVIVEGMDNSGKTVLVNQLAEELRLVQVRNNIRHPQSMADLNNYFLSILNLDRGLNKGLILDRWPPISEPIYGEVLRRTVLMSQSTKANYHRCVRNEAMLIWCRPPNSTLLDFGSREQMSGVREKADQLIEAYDREMEFISGYLNIHIYDYTVDSYNLLSLKVQEFLEHQKC